ncbi:hypothetical protein CWI82_09975 [Pseudidiomarina tainanensis]|uniref:Uncharacterized protein n=2 Tax=Pseudidiomarina TaxID=2800384 RepID=A0A1I6HB94_9GAMM|nr:MULTISPECIES: hypothetical protein [Pseudidiomarina]RZQ55692.1 hypothetical protein CWI82_09975 [Pseudidiomarina tainanensis]SFR51621.1 hypothetical protein SAMN04488070_1687 [Pseudidiomarina maritima]
MEVSNRKLVIGCLLFTLLFSRPVFADEADEIEGISLGCQVTSVFIGGALVNAGLRMYNLSQSVSSGIAAVSGAFGPNVLDEVCDATAEEMLRYARSHAPIDYDSYISENCNGDPFGCTDPSLIVNSNSCSTYVLCPDSPLNCSSFIVCIDPMLGENGFSTNDLIAATNYLSTSWLQGFWHSPNSEGGKQAWEIN